MDSNIFNIRKSDYSTPQLILGPQAPGLFDTINKQYPDIWALYKKQKSIDWSEDEFNYSSAVHDFNTCDRSTYDMMIKTLAWQFEADSIFSRSIAPVFAPFISSSELWAAWQKVSEIEVLHAATYSEIVRNSFDDPRDILSEILKVQEAHSRLETVSKAFSTGYKSSHKYALGLIENDQSLYNDFMLMLTALYLGERVQFMSSFAVTFGICESGLFQSVGKAIQKICQDEFEVHAQLDKVVLLHELDTSRGQTFIRDHSDTVQSMIKEVIQSESDWVDYLFSDGRSLPGITAQMLKDWTLFCASDVIRTFNLSAEFKTPKRNPLKYMESWINIGLIQPAPQEQQVSMYKLNVMTRDDSNSTFNLDF